MMITTPQIGDLNKVREIHERFYKDEFEFPDNVDFIRLARYKGQIVGYCALRKLHEVIMILDKDQSSFLRARMIKEFLDESPTNELHAFCQDRNFIDVLQNHFGFRPTKGQALVRIIG